MLEARFFPSLLQPATIAGVAPIYALPIVVVVYVTLLTQGLTFPSFLALAAVITPLYLFGSWATEHDPFAPQAFLGSAGFTAFYPAQPFE